MLVSELLATIRRNEEARQRLLEEARERIVAAGLCHGFPVSSSGSRTVLGDAMGSRSQLYSLVTMVAVLLTTAPPWSILSPTTMKGFDIAVLLAGGPVGQMASSCHRER